jgi:hypothetical protein
MKTEEKLYLAPEDLYRLGNATSPLMTRMRPGEVDIVAINGINTIVANGKGVSLYNKTGLALAPLKGWVWEISARTPFHSDLKLVKDTQPPGHYTLCPARNMPVNEFVALLEKVAIHCKRVFKKEA